MGDPIIKPVNGSLHERARISDEMRHFSRHGASSVITISAIVSRHGASTITVTISCHGASTVHRLRHCLASTIVIVTISRHGASTVAVSVTVSRHGASSSPSLSRATARQPSTVSATVSRNGASSSPTLSLSLVPRVVLSFLGVVDFPLSFRCVLLETPLCHASLSRLSSQHRA